MEIGVRYSALISLSCGVAISEELDRTGEEFSDVSGVLGSDEICNRPTFAEVASLAGKDSQSNTPIKLSKQHVINEYNLLFTQLQSRPFARIRTG
jgi:hypothetical protein